MVQHADASWIFERTKGAESIDEYDGTVKIKNIGSGKTHETWKSTDVWWVGLGVYAANPAEDMWNVCSDPRSKIVCGSPILPCFEEG